MADLSYRIPDYACTACHGTKFDIRFRPVPEYQNRLTPFVYGKCGACEGSGRRPVSVAEYKMIAAGLDSIGLEGAQV